LVKGGMLDYIAFEDHNAMAKRAPPVVLLDVPLAQSGIRRQHGVTVVGVKTPGGSFSHATGETVLRQGDTVIVSGQPAAVERFTDLR
ncbi:MAG: TrkA C-terminal domain-containing protein, partial [Frankiales bacterium]|nr:TrkA C-terminal domain-containing protein [Frankiales bacterium]